MLTQIQTRNTTPKVKLKKFNIEHILFKVSFEPYYWGLFWQKLSQLESGRVGVMCTIVVMATVQYRDDATLPLCSLASHTFLILRALSWMMRFISPSYADHSTSTQTIAGSLTAAYSIRSVSVLARERGLALTLCVVRSIQLRVRENRLWVEGRVWWLNSLVRMAESCQFVKSVLNFSVQCPSRSEL